MCTSLDLKQMHVSNRVKAHDFFKLYKTEAETSLILENNKKMDNSAFEKKKKKHNTKPSLLTEQQEALTISELNIDGESLTKNNTSTPAKEKNKKTGKVKSIIKNSSSIIDESLTDTATSQKSEIKRKKRIKSVSFLLDETEQIVVKKSKSNDAGKSNESPMKKLNKKDKHSISVKKEAEKENHSLKDTSHGAQITNPKKKNMKRKFKTSENANSDNENQSISIPKLNESTENAEQKSKNNLSHETITKPGNEMTVDDQNIKKDKNRKHPKNKFNKKELTEYNSQNVKPEIIAEDLKNLNIGDNAHTITDLLDEMAVVNKPKKKKGKGKIKNDKTAKSLSSPNEQSTQPEQVGEEKEKVVWKKSRWNKGNNFDSSQVLLTSVTVENLPLKLVLEYRKLLNERFEKYGPIKYITSAEVYPTEDNRPVFTTSINFKDEEAANQALVEDNTIFEGNRIRVKRPLPPTKTTIVVRSYGKLTEESLSSVFVAAGRIRKIRFLIKGKKSVSTAFIEFDGPEAVESALNLAADARVGGKKLHVSKFEERRTKIRNKTE